MIALSAATQHVGTRQTGPLADATPGRYAPSMRRYFRPIPTIDPAQHHAALRLAGGWCHFSHLEILDRSGPARIIPATEAPQPILDRLTAPRAPLAGISLDRPRLMGILNLTPDSFSDGGLHSSPEAALAAGRALVAEGADVLDAGGESTRPGAQETPVAEEIARTAGVIEELVRAGLYAPISIDTRKAEVARAAFAAGASIVNDVSAFRFDPELAEFAAKSEVPVILMHSLGTPDRMQDMVEYEDVLLDVYDALEERIGVAEAAGIPRARIVVDPGIGFGKHDPENQALLRRISLFHSLGCPVLLGVSRKGMIGRVGAIPEPSERDAASAAVGLWALSQGIQMLRVHDISIHRQMIALWQAASGAAAGQQKA